MKLLTIREENVLRAAVLCGHEVLDLSRAGDVVSDARLLPTSLKLILAGGAPMLDTLRAVIGAAAQAPAQDALRAAGALRAFADVTLAPVIPDADIVLCGSMNSRGHLAEMGDSAPDMPVGFLKVRGTLIGSGQPILCPPDNGDMVDWEGEFCVVIGSPCYRVAEADAMDYVAGYTLMNDVSAREFVMPYVRAKERLEVTGAWERNVLGKNFPTFCPLGPVLLTKDEVPLAFNYLLETVVNGQVVQSSTPEDLIFSIPEMIAYFSVFYHFQPGDVISLGSPPGVGMMMKPQKFLRPGDVVEVREPHIGSLVSTVALAQPQTSRETRRTKEVV
jgi:acylpyruvate hydrolase